jgi:hypothetical protein
MSQSIKDVQETLIRDFRDIKLHLVIGGEFQPRIDLKKLRRGNNIFFNQKYWPILKSWRGKCTITGSAALYAFGLLDRLPGDIDFLVNKNNFKINQKLYQNQYEGMEGELDVLGYYTQNGYNVDFFHNDSHSKIEVDGFYFHHPFEIIHKKIDILKSRYVSKYGTDKDLKDILYLFKKLKSDYTFFN